MNIPLVLEWLPPILRRHKLIQILTAIFPESRVQRVRFNGSAEAWVDLVDPQARQLVISRSFDPEFFRIASPFLAKGGVFFDLGANYGLCSFGLIPHMKQRVEFHLFEANPRLCGILEKTASLHPLLEIRVNCGCVSDEKGSSRFRIEKDSGKSFVSADGGETLPNVVLGGYLRERSIPKIDFLKSDVEGFELKAFRGMARELASGSVKAVYFEMITQHLKRAGSGNGEMLDFLKGCGFSVFHCKAADFTSGTMNSFPVTRDRVRKLNVHGDSLYVAPVVREGAERMTFHTDLLAVHPSSGLL